MKRAMYFGGVYYLSVISRHSSTLSQSFYACLVPHTFVKQHSQDTRDVKMNTAMQYRKKYLECEPRYELIQSKPKCVKFSLFFLGFGRSGH